METIKCKKCGRANRQMKSGFTRANSQRYLCGICNYKYTPITKHYTEETKQLAVKTYLAGNSARGTGRIFGVDGNTITAWVIFFRGESAIRQSQRK